MVKAEYSHCEMVNEAFPSRGPLQEIVYPGLDGVFGMDSGKRRLFVGYPVLEHLVVSAVRLWR